MHAYKKGTTMSPKRANPNSRRSNVSVSMSPDDLAMLEDLIYQRSQQTGKKDSRSSYIRHLLRSAAKKRGLFRVHKD